MCGSRGPLPDTQNQSVTDNTAQTRSMIRAVRGGRNVRRGAVELLGGSCVDALFGLHAAAAH